MADTFPSLKLSQAAAFKALEAGITKARALGVPQCIAVVDDGGHLLAFVRMDGARFVSIDSSCNKAVAAASTRRVTGPRGDSDTELKLAIVTRGHNPGLKGGVPILIGEFCVGGIGVGSGTGEQDREVALAAVAAIAGAKTDFVLTD